MPVELYQKHPAAMHHLDALGHGQASAYTDIPHLGGSAQLCAYPGVPRRARPLGSCAVRHECCESEC